MHTKASFLSKAFEMLMSDALIYADYRRAMRAVWAGTIANCAPQMIYTRSRGPPDRVRMEIRKRPCQSCN